MPTDPGWNRWTRIDLPTALARLIVDEDSFTADDLTVGGLMVIDPDRKPNSSQNRIGSAFRHWSEQGLIRWTGDVVQSRSPRRKGGMIRVWESTPKGRAWATQWLLDR
jgi:hypothetical protein